MALNKVVYEIMEFIHQNQHFKFPFTGNIDSLIFDPDIWLISANNQVSISIDEPKLKKEISIFPNPVGRELNIQSSHLFERIEIVSMNGQRVNDFEFKETLATTVIPDCSAGLYIINVYLQSEKLSSQKIQIIK